MASSFQSTLPFLTKTISNSTNTHGHKHSHSNYSNGSLPNRRTSLASFHSSRPESQMSQVSPPPSKSPLPPGLEGDRVSDQNSQSKTSSTGISSQHSSLSPPRRANPHARPSRKLRSQYPRGSTENHVEYILVASFDIDRGPVMEHQYPVAITGDENMLAELMLPDQAHARNQDWTIFFLHKDTSQEEEDEERKAKEERKKRRKRRRDRAAGIIDEEDEETEEDLAEDEFDDDDDDDDDEDDNESTDSEPEGGEGPPLIYVLNLVNTKHDKSVKRGAIVKAMAICTRHPFLHIYKASSLPAQLLSLEEYFKAPVPETLAMLYDSVNAMDLSLMPKLSLLERHLLQASDNRDLFVEKFERMIQMRIAEDQREEAADQSLDATRSPTKLTGISRAGTKAHVEGGQSVYSVPRDTHEFESKVMYKGIPIPIKVPVAVMPETVGDFSLIKLIQNFSDTHQKSPQPFALHPHLTTNGANTHPIVVLANALLTQKRIIFLGYNMPSGEVAEAVLAACALASGGILRGFTRHAFPYTDLTKIDDLLNVPGFIAGVTNPTFELHPEWWDVLCDLPSGRVKISTKIDPAPVTEGLLYFQQQNAAFATIASGTSSTTQDYTGDSAFMADVLRSIAARHGERVIRAKWRDWVAKFTQIAAKFEESVYGASALYIGGEDQDLMPPGANGHGPLKGLDLAHLHDRLRMQRLTSAQSRDIYLTISKHVHTYDEVCLLLSVAPESHAGLFYLGLGLFHKDREVRLRTADLLERVAEHEAGQHWWKSLSRFEKLAYMRLRREVDAEMQAKLEKEGVGPELERRIS
ncbi:hypothetical protein F66182_9518 [Fusarium sp. NRRL 66182]|nr:hypothetical protein F66182_9518 [Fusarium sp. NRRL 66182]